MSDRATLEACFAAAVDAVHGDRAIERGMRDFEWPPSGGRLRLIALGKASVAMAHGARRILARMARERASVGAQHALPTEGLLIVKEEPAKNPLIKALELDADIRWRVVQGGHPQADGRSLKAGRVLLDFVTDSQREDRYLMLLSGGASALAVQPIAGLTLAQKSACIEALMQRGAPIEALNLLRRHLSRIKGGGLARAMVPARCLTLAISDVPGDDRRVIGSAPTLDLPLAPAAAIAILKEYDLWQQWESVLQPLWQSVNPVATPPAGRHDPYVIVASLDDALAAAQAAGQRHALQPVNLGRCFYGDLAAHVRQFCEVIRQQVAQPSATGSLVLAAGEPLLSVLAGGRGGRAQHFALACAEQLQGLPSVTVLAAGTDGTDGPTPAAGACVDGCSWSALQAAGINPARALAEYDSYSALQSIDALLHTGPTGTNVADLFLAVVH